jgi:hypothetical protein
MKTYKNVDEFISDVFPEKYEDINTQKKTNVEQSIDRINSEFDEKVKAVIEGKNDEKKKA